MAAPDFYFAINATFRYFYRTYGEAGLIAYWEALGDEYFDSLSQRFREGGLDAVEEYWRDFFAAEPGGEVDVVRHGDRVEILVLECPAIHHLRRHGREVMPLYCRHCFHVSSVIARKAGLGFQLQGGDGRCLQTFYGIRDAGS
jgi:hypothetical protein